MLIDLVAGGIDLARKQRRPLRDVLALDEDAMLTAVGGSSADRLRSQLDAVDLAAVRERVAGSSVLMVCRHDARYPLRLLDDRSAAPVLYVLARDDRACGRLGIAAGTAHGEQPPVVSIVGTRKASPEALSVTRTLARGLAAAGVTVVSGMALGVDSAAHEGALEPGGLTVAVLAGGPTVPYPRSKARLWERIAQQGVVLSEMPPGHQAFKWNFLARNRLIAGLATVTIVVEAAERSGSLVTADMAMELGRDVAAVPGSVLSWRSRGTNALLRDGATLVRDACDALDLVLGVDRDCGAVARTPRHGVVGLAGLDPQLRRLLAAIDEGRDTVTAMAADPVDAAAVRAGLMELELLGLVERLQGGRVRRVVVGRGA